MLTYAGAIQTFTLGMSITIWVKSRILSLVPISNLLAFLGSTLIKENKKLFLGKQALKDSESENVFLYFTRKKNSH